MQTNFISYDVEKSSQRIEAIITANDNDYQETDSLPDRNKLTYNNGYYVNVGAIFVDIRNSSELTNEHKRPKLAKLYKSYISEVVAILNNFPDCKEINIVGDCVSGIFDGQYKNQIEALFNASVMINSLIKILNYKYSKNNIINIKLGIGLAWGRALMIKVGYYGTGINDVVWMGDVVNEASNLCNNANKNYRYPILLDEDIYNNLNDTNKNWCSYCSSNIYGANIINTNMDNWYKSNCT